jgi:hypothetical protein
MYLLNIMQERYTTKLKKIHGLELEDLRSLPFNVDAAYAVGGGTLHGRYLLFSVKYCQFITFKFIRGLLWAMRLWTLELCLMTYFLHFLVHSVISRSQRQCNGGKIQASGRFYPKPPTKSATHFVDTVGKSLNMCNLSNSNIAYFVIT